MGHYDDDYTYEEFRCLKCNEKTRACRCKNGPFVKGYGSEKRLHDKDDKTLHTTRVALFPALQLETKLSDKDVEALNAWLYDVSQAMWRPIENAPKDGQHILVTDLTGRTGFGRGQAWANVVHWFNDGFYASSFGGEQSEPYGNLLTHWMPLLQRHKS